MMSSSSSPKLPKWIFFLADAILIFAAWLIATRSGHPLPAAAIYSITACVVAGAAVGTVPLILHYERVKNETLDDRQRALEALAATITTSAEQIGIAAQGLHEIAEIARKNLQQAEQLPQALQEKVASFQAQLAGSRDEEREALRKELYTLRGVEAERLSGTALKIQQAVAELSKVEVSAQKSLAATQAAIAQGPESLARATAAALAEIDAKLASRAAATIAAIDAAEAKRPRKARTDETSAVSRAKPDSSKGAEVGTHILPIVPVTAAPFSGNIISISPPPAAESPQPPSETATAEPSPTLEPTPAEPPSSPAETAESAPAAPESPVVDAPSEAPGAEITLTEASPVPAPEDAPTTEEPRLARKRAPRKPKPAETAEIALDLGITESPPASVADEFSQVAPNETAEKVISSDGATRLLVTAYIGIGNRLFIRGDGPGLTWEKGVPLQFVSIGKWRWETAEASAPVTFKLFKNDETESAALGTMQLESGHQQEVTATF
ncbi:MAG: hypothetical protein JWM32_845 [Verrucomicrobia bacterium]|nr:hypothetical protein [Verrucomicrobiota bacterium]